MVFASGVGAWYVSHERGTGDDDATIGVPVFDFGTLWQAWPVSVVASLTPRARSLRWNTSVAVALATGARERCGDVGLPFVGGVIDVATHGESPNAVGAVLPVRRDSDRQDRATSHVGGSSLRHLILCSKPHGSLPATVGLVPRPTR